MLDPQLGFSGHVERVRAEQIVILVHRPREGILDRHDPTPRRSRFDRAKYLDEGRARKQADGWPVCLERCRMTERAGFPLDGDRVRHPSPRPRCCWTPAARTSPARPTYSAAP